MNRDTRKHAARPNKPGTLRDPVCGMVIDARENPVVYRQIHFAFCSLQCKQRFLNNPELYVGHTSPAQAGGALLRQRRIRLEEPLDTEMAQNVADAVQAMMGIERVEIDGDSIRVVYDLLQATEAQIESEIGRAGAGLGGEWSERLRRAFVHYVEESEVENLAAPSSTHIHHL